MNLPHVSRLLAIALCGAALSAHAVLDKKRPEGVRSLQGTVVLKDGVFHCAAPGHPSAKLYTSCLNIPVIVLAKEEGGCLSLLPYAQLTVHTKRERVLLRWKAFGMKGATFHSSSGIDIDMAAANGTPRGDVYDGNTGSGDQFEWFIKLTAPAGAQFYHKAIVSVGGTDCEPIDPVIFNVEN
jgi:hypothetical protein